MNSRLYVNFSYMLQDAVAALSFYIISCSSLRMYFVVTFCMGHHMFIYKTVVCFSAEPVSYSKATNSAARS